MVYDVYDKRARYAKFKVWEGIKVKAKRLPLLDTRKKLVEVHTLRW